MPAPEHRFPANLDSVSGAEPFGFQQVENFVSTLLNGDHLAGATTITVDSTAQFPARGYVVIDAEIISYTGKTATTFTGCTRGDDGTTAAAHSDNTSVLLVPLAANHNDVAGAVVAVETKLGIGASTPVNNTALTGNGDGSSAWSGSLDLGDGSTGNPTYGFGSDPDTGVRLAAAGDVRVVTSGVDRLAVTDTGADLSVPLSMSAQKITDLSDPTVAQDAATMAYVDAEIVEHAGLADPHPGYTTAAELATGISAHAGEADPHTGYQKESEKGAVGGYASLDGSGLVPDAQIPSTIARDSEVTSAISTHAGEADPHTGYLQESILDAKGDLIAASAADTPARLAVGTNGQVLTAQSGQATGLQWVTHDSTGDPHTQYATDSDLSTHAGAADPHAGYVLESVFDAKGDILAASADNTPVRRAVGTDGQYLVAASGQASGLNWQTHDSTGDPHTQYALDTDLTTHAGAADPHTGYQKESEKGAASGYASLDGSTKVPIAELPTGTSGTTVALGNHGHDTFAEDINLTGDISPAQITVDQNDYSPTGLSTASTLRLSSDAARNITGLAGGADGRLLLVHNVGAQNIVLKDESVSSTAANRFALAGDLTLGADQGCILQYDATSSRWRAATPASAGGGVTDHGALTGLSDDDHPQYALDTDLTTHAGAADPHTGYVLESLIDAKGDIVTATAADTPARLAVGTNGQVLTAQSGQATGLQWATHDSTGDPHSQYATDTDLSTHAGAADPHAGYVLESLVDAKGDIVTATAADTPARLAAGSNGQVLTAQSGQATGLQWATHDGTGDPHTQYALDTDLTTHAGAADPHAGYVLESLVNAKGDLYVGTADNTVARKAAGADGFALVAHSGQSDGLIYRSIPNPNSLINGNFVVNQQFPGAQTVATDDTYFWDQWNVLMEANGDADALNVATPTPSGAQTCGLLRALVANKKFGMVQFLTASQSADLLLNNTGVVSLQFSALSWDTSVTSLKAAILTWTGTADVLTSDVVSTWGATGVTPTFATNWTLENTPVAISINSGAWITAKIENIAVDAASGKNLAVCIWNDDSVVTAFHGFLVADVKLEPGPVCTEFISTSWEEEVQKCLPFYQKSFPRTTAVAQAAGRPGAHEFGMWVAGAVARSFCTVYLSTPMFKIPAITFYNPDAANAMTRDMSGSLDCSTTVSDRIGDRSFNVVATPHASSSAGNFFAVHWTANARL